MKVYLALLVLMLTPFAGLGVMVLILKYDKTGFGSFVLWSMFFVALAIVKSHRHPVATSPPVL
jgi:hypothetical protein